MNGRLGLVATIVIALLAVLIISDASRLPPSPTKGGLGPGQLPLWVGGFILVLSVLQLVRQLVAKEWNTVVTGRRDATMLHRVALMLGALIVYVFLSGVIGFFLSSWLFLTIGMKILANYRWHLIIGGSLAGALVSAVLFRDLLTVPLPVGPFGL